MKNHGIPNDFTLCEEFGGYIIAVRDGSYCAFTRFGGIQANGISEPTRAAVRAKINERVEQAGGRPIKSGDIPLAVRHVFRWMLQGDRAPEIYGWVEVDHSIVQPGGFWRTPDPEEAARRACAAFDLKMED